MNTNFTKNPIVGTPLTPSVIKQIHTAVRRYMPIAGNGIRTSVTAGGTIISAIPAPAPKKQKDKPLPFEVRYDGTLDSGAGGWKIYLPTEHLVQFDGAYLDPLNDVTPILDANGDETGWYSFDEITLQDDHVWLVISESSGAYTASFANAEDQQAVANICIAEVSYEAATQSTPETITIKQSVVGAIVINRGEDPAPPAPFDIGETKRDAQPDEEGDEDGKVVVSGIVNCKFFWDGAEKTLPDFPIPGGTATVYLNCVGTASQSASAVRGYTWEFSLGTSPASTGGDIYRNYKIYDFTDGKVALDWRHTFLALFSDTAKEVEPDGVSIDKIPDAAPDTTPDGDEGQLQIKGFNAGQPADTNTIAEYLMGTAQISGQIWLVVRGESTGGDPVLSYLPLDALNLDDYAKKTDLPPAPGDGTLTIKQGTTTLGTFTANQAGGTTVTIPEPSTSSTVNDGTLTIKQGTTTLGTFTANQEDGTTVTIPEPPTVNDGTLTLNLGSITKTFKANQAANETLTIPAKTIAAGSNVAISVNGNTITISATSATGGGSTSGFTGTRRTLALTRYDVSTNQLQAKFFTETWSNGLMTASAIDSAWSAIEGGQAVMETV